MMGLVRAAALASALLVVAVATDARAEAGRPAPLSAEPLSAAPAGSLVTTEALGCGNWGMSMSGGMAVLLPFYGLELGVGLIDTVDLVARFETVIGIFHYPHLGLRWMPFEIGSWRFGTRLQAHYSFFGIKTDQVNFTSTFYLLGEIGISGPVSQESELVIAVQSEFDFFEYRVVDDVGEVEGSYRYDATTPRIAVETKVSDDLDGFAQLRLRIPTETFQFEAQTLYVVPMLEIGGTWTF